jgi:cyclic-di-GMP-binding protein
MPSFDVVSEVDEMEVKNAVEQARKELANRFDFREAKAEIILEKEAIKLSAVDQFKLQALEEIVLGKLARRNVSLKNIERKEADVSPLGHARQELKLKQGLETDVAKIIVQAIRDTKLKVQAQIQDRQIRVTGKSRDDLQAVIATLRGRDFPVALNYTNVRA